MITSKQVQFIYDIGKEPGDNDLIVGYTGSDTGKARVYEISNKDLVV